jgi:hypothetical protein
MLHHLYAYEVNYKTPILLPIGRIPAVMTSSGNVKLDWLGKIMQADNI